MAKRMRRKARNYCKGNVMTPLNWFATAFEGVLVPTSAYSYNNWLGVACFVLAALFALVYVSIYIYWLLYDPDRLQSEEYNLHQQEILIEGGPVTLPADQRVIEVQANKSIESDN